MNKINLKKYETKLLELELVLDEIIFSIEWLLKEMEGLRKNKKEVEIMQLSVMYFNDALEEIKENGKRIIEGYGEIYYDKELL